MIYMHMICTYDMRVWCAHIIKQHTLAKLQPLNILSLPIAKNAVTIDNAVEKNSPPNIKVHSNWKVYEKRLLGSLVNAVVVCEYCNCVDMFVGWYCVLCGNGWGCGTNVWWCILLGCMLICRVDDGMNAVMMLNDVMLWHTTNLTLETSVYTDGLVYWMV